VALGPSFRVARTRIFPKHQHIVSLKAQSQPRRTTQLRVLACSLSRAAHLWHRREMRWARIYSFGVRIRSGSGKSSQTTNTISDMKTFRETILGALIFLLVSAVHSSAVEGLRLSVHCPDVWLSWPSVEGETYVVQHQPDLGTSSTWNTLTNSFPAATGTNRTVFVHSSQVNCPTGQVFGMMMSGSGSAGVSSTESDLSSSKEEPYSSLWLQVEPKDKSSPPAPLQLYPPGLDLDGHTIVWPDGSTEPWTKEFAEEQNAAITFDESQDGSQQDSGGGGDPGCGFYRVVRAGVDLHGITNGTVLNGQVSLPFEFGIADTNRTIDQVFVTDHDSDANLTGSSFPSFPLSAGASPAGVWDTTQTTNGNYMLQLGALLDDGTVLMDTPISVTVSNLIYQPDPWNVGGVAIYVGFKTVFTSGTWHLDAYDSQDAYIGYLEGYIDTDGYCNYPGIPGPGFSVDNTDGSGNQLPSPHYTLVITAVPGGATPPYPSATNKVFIEPPWNYYTRAISCYQQVFPSWQPGADEVRLLMEFVWAVEEIYHQNLLGGFTTVHEVNAQGWGPVTNSLLNPAARDFVYFGHGHGDELGGGGLTIPMVNTLLRNNLKDPLTATNMHPFRFVFLDGCNTADGDWPQTFGIPKKEGMVVTDFTGKRGIRPRAFMGWNRTKVVGTRIISGGGLYPPHMDYVDKFWNYWGNGTTGLRPVKDAISEAKRVAPLAAGGMMLYGAEDLVINY
jgi:hypothetical protein